MRLTGHLLIAFFFNCASIGFSYAMTIDVSPSPATIGETVTADVQISFAVAEAGKQVCPIALNWDDPPGVFELYKGSSCFQERHAYTCMWHGKHSYTVTGIYMIRVKSVGNDPLFPNCIPFQPQAAETSIEVTPIFPGLIRYRF
jgi:hypothetical protein